jgi:hypothetical protein
VTRPLKAQQATRRMEIMLKMTAATDKTTLMTVNKAFMIGTSIF